MIDFDRLTLAPAFSIFGEAATYVPPSGSSVPCRVVREGGGTPLKFGPITVYAQALSFEVRAAEVSAPVSGGAFMVGADTFTVTGSPYHPEEDAHGLVWSCPVTWGAPVVYRSLTGSGATLNPPTGSGYVIATAAAAGTTSVNIKASLASGQLRPGDYLTVGSRLYAITNTVSAASNTFTGVQISPALVAPVAVGDAVVFTWARDYAVLAGVAGYVASEVMGGVAVGDRRVVITQDQLTAAGMVDVPKASDKITFEGRQFTVQSAGAVYQGAAPLVWDLQCR